MSCMTAKISSVLGVCLALLVTAEGLCHKKADIVFVIDSSSTIGKDNFEIVKDFTKTIVNAFEIGDDAAYIGMIQYSSAPEVVVFLNNNRDNILNKIDAAKYHNGARTKTCVALRYAREVMFIASNGARPGVPKIIFFLTDGLSYNRLVTETEAELNHKQHITTFAIGVGNTYQPELEMIGSKPSTTFVNHIDDFSGLDDLAKELTKKACICHIKTDTVFVLDGSKTIGKENFKKVMEFVKKLVDSFETGDSTAYIGIIQYSNNAVCECDLIGDKAAIMTDIDNIEYQDGSRTRTAEALEAARVMILNKGRANVRKKIVFITDGISYNPKQTMEKADLNHQAGIMTYAVGIGNTWQSELERIASSPSTKYVDHVEGFDDLQQLVDELTGKACEE